MAKNFKIADLKMSSIYSVSLIDNWDGSTEQKNNDRRRIEKFHKRRSSFIRHSRNRN